jgi:archaellum component FlaC
MTERLDRIEQSIERLGSALDVIVTEFIRPSAQQTAANYERLNRVDETLERVAQQQEATEQQTAANAEAISRLESLVATNNQAIAANDVRFENLLNDSRADRAEWRTRFDASNQRFDAQLNEIRAQGEQIRALLSALATTNGRVDTLEQAS